MKTLRSIELRGAAEHNLQSVDVDIPLRRLTVVCGVSGSGKTSLALDTLYAEGQRRYIESFSAYTRQFLARIDKPRFDSLDNLPPSLAVTRGDRSRNNRSTIGTASEVLEPLRILFSHVASPYCPTCSQPIMKHSASSLAKRMSTLGNGRAMLGFELNWESKPDLSQQLYDLQSSGFIRVILTDDLVELSEDLTTVAKKVPAKGAGMVVIDRFRIDGSPLSQSTLQSLELAFERADHNVVVLVASSNGAQDSSVVSDHNVRIRVVSGQEYDEHLFTKSLRCAECDQECPESEPRLFSFNSPIGACSQCTGFGEVSDLDFEKIVPDRKLSLREGAIAPWRTPSYEHELHELLAIADEYCIPLDLPVAKLSSKHWDLIQHGVPAKSFGGLDGFFAWLERKKYKMHIRAFLARWKSYSVCPKCHGQRLSPGALAYRFRGMSFSQINEMTIDDLRGILQELRGSSEYLPLGADARAIEPVLKQVLSRLDYLIAVGLGYLTLGRTMHTLSGGEAQRVNLTTLLGSDLVDMLYVLDEPTVGLHPSDTVRVAGAVKKLVERGNTVVLIEHEPYLLFQADHVLEIGPGAGARGGEVCFSGKASDFRKSKTLTAKYLSSRISSRSPREVGTRRLELCGARGRNLKNVDLKIPLGCLCTIVGVSGSGKSSLVLDTLVPAIAASKGESSEHALPFDRLIGGEQIRGCVAIDQFPIAKSIRSTPATYVKAMDEIRIAFASSIDAKAAGLTESHFSFNSSAGRCPFCEGLGFTSVDMQFMADVRLVCSECNGKRFMPRVLDIRYRDRDISEVLNLSIVDAIEFFRGERKLQMKLQPLVDIGLGYLPLGQSVSSLSAGESMRLKLASHLEEKSRQLIVMDEPTTGLHFADVDRLLACIDVLIDQGNSVLVIEHNEQMIRASDYLIEVGPFSGDKGGEIVFEGMREDFLKSAKSVTATVLREGH
ncbi:MAG: excinuclease ABC subunit A [Planctomycetes bacterium]|nr:excinuclease ABC subunit A [Planctomycetota bacterium]